MTLIRITNLILPLDHSDQDLKQLVLKRLGIPEDNLQGLEIQKRSVDARRKGAIKLVYSVVVNVQDARKVMESNKKKSSIRAYHENKYQIPRVTEWKGSLRPVVVGTGPAGLFAGLVLAEAGVQPLLLERGKPVKERTKSTFHFWRNRELDPESNVQFGEGGAGTFSDGKLYSRINDDQGRDRKVLEELVKAGAPEEILVAHKPHIGTLKLVKIVQNMREKILKLGGEYRFQSRVENLVVRGGQVSGLKLADGEFIPCDQVILAVGHSARDTFQMLLEKGVSLAPKPFSIGLRIEHPQSLIDKSQYGDAAGHPRLGAADYQLVHHSSGGRTVYSFCMCPGGSVLAASSEPGMVVTNGMSQYSRRERNANSALVVEVNPEDFPPGPLGGIDYQRRWEIKAFEAGGYDYRAPVQRLEDFLKNRPTESIGAVEPSYQPGVQPANLNHVLPDYVVQALQEAVPEFERKIRNFNLPDAILTGVETRTSSPVTILRDKTMESVSTPGLFPAGEGSGYAGGILSSAVDGIKAAEAVLERAQSNKR